MATPTLGGVNLTGLMGIASNKTANIIPIPIPGSDSSSTEVFDMLGVVKIITLTGEYGGTGANVDTFIAALEALCQGNQSTITFTDENSNSTTVMVADVQTEKVLPGYTCPYTIRLIQGVGMS